MTNMYFPISEFYKQRFGEKVYKIPVSTASSCPNREGLRGMKTCNFCDVWGSAAYPEIRHQELQRQIEATRVAIRKRTRANRFLVYFQAYTNTFQKSQILREQFEAARALPDIAGFVVGTRPDCLSEAALELWNEFARDYFVAVELGVQSFDENQLLWMRRGHTSQKSIEACHRLHRQCPDVNLGIHLIFGLPGETDQDVIQSARQTNELPIHNVKLHHLHVLHQTPLEDEYKRGLFTPLDLERYAHRVVLFLQHLRPDIAIHRLSALSRRPEELVAPEWTAKKMAIYQTILDLMKARGAYQGEKVSNPIY